MEVLPFEIKIPDQALEDLKFRIRHTRWPEPALETDWAAGTDQRYLRSLTEYWSDIFSWRQIENRINSYPNFITQINGFDIHFIHIKGKGNSTLPLIITHGWPGSFLEMMEIIPWLTEATDLAFDLIIPSIPGFGFSSHPSQRGVNSAKIAGLWHQLMNRLGYRHYGVQGGDVGAGIGTCLALQHPEAVIGLHLNYIPGSYKPYLPEGEKLTAEEHAFQQNLSNWMASEGAYSHLHSTKPQTLAYGLHDSPVGLCAWILEKFFSWSDNGGDIENMITKDTLLANVTLYWLTQTLSSSIHLYRENRLNPTLSFPKGQYIGVPVAFARFPKELPTPPRSYVERGYNIQQWNEMPAGGHFAALEQPELLSNDIRIFFKTL